MEPNINNNNESSLNTTLNDSISRSNHHFGIFKNNNSKNKTKLTKQFSNSTEYSCDQQQQQQRQQQELIKKTDGGNLVEQETLEIEKMNEVNSIENPNRNGHKSNRKNLLENKLKSNEKKKSSRSLSRCLSCTRANNNTNTSLDKI